jgi:hypothetical protein
MRSPAVPGKKKIGEMIRLGPRQRRPVPGRCATVFHDEILGEKLQRSKTYVLYKTIFITSKKQ